VQIVDEGLSDPEEHGIWISPCLLTPESRGSVRLASSDPTAKPVIRHNYYAAESDMQRQMAAMRLLLEIAGQPALRPYCAEPFTVPGSESDDDLREHVARHTTTLYHPVGTCAMGSVVDADLRVQGLEGLRVVDASVMPVVPRGNTNAPVIALAERAADLIAGRAPVTVAEAGTAS
jgi:choline dehydrogenase